MNNNQSQSDRALEDWLATAARPKAPRAGLAAEIAARARQTPQQKPSRNGAFAAGFALAASLMIGVWLGANDTTAQYLPQLNANTTTADSGFSADDLVNGGDVL